MPLRLPATRPYRTRLPATRLNPTRLLPLFLLAATLPAQPPAPAPPTPAAILRDRIAQDPANLQGERVTPQSLADTLPINHGAPALQQLLLKLRTRASLMFIVAHPDDEDSGLLTFESRGHGVRTAMLTLTRGEGGQNLMSADFNDGLGLIRTQELLAEDRFTGTDQFFGTEIDFGFSKLKEETLAQWTHDRVLYDAVRAVRLYRPLVLASVFVGGPTDGHGHHQVSGEICQEVFLAAADPNVFPEMNLPPWAPLKVYARVPFSRVTAEGMFDYATGKTIPTLFHNYVTNTDTHEVPTATVQIHEGDPATVTFAGQAQPALGMEGLSYSQFARKGLAQQKTQIGANVRPATAGPVDSGYTLMANRIGPSPATEQSMFDNIDTSLPALSADPKIKQQLLTIDSNLGEAQSLFDPENLELTAPPLRDALRALDLLIASLPTTPESFDLLHELRIKRVQLNQALALAHHLSLTAVVTSTTQPQLLSTISSLAATLTLTNEGADSIRIASTQLTVNMLGEGVGQGNADSLEPRSTRTLDLRLPYLAGLFPTRPYFSRQIPDQPFYDIAIPALRNAPATPAPIVAHATLDDQGVLIELATIIPSPAPATPPQALVVVPPVSVELSPRAAILRPAEPTLAIHIHLSGLPPKPQSCTPNPHPGRPAPPLEGKLGLILPEPEPVIETAAQTNPEAPAPSVTLPQAKTLEPPTPSATSVTEANPHPPATPTTWSLTPETQPYDPACPNAHPDFAFTLTPPAALAPNTAADFKAAARAFAHNYTESYRPVGYPGLTYTDLYTPATLKAVATDVITAPGLRVAYLPGTGDEIPAFLPNLGITPTMVTVADLTAEKLAAYDVVLLGVRAYAAHPELAHAGSKPLNDFASTGGVVIVQYNTGSDATGTAPYPFNLPGDSAHNVVDETDPVTLLDPAAPLLNYPNKITPADFNGWTEERGHGFASTWDPAYTPLLETHDPGQDPQKGGLLLAPVGKGAYIYCAYALYRQLPEAVPGAYRLLANLLSYPKNPNR